MHTLADLARFPLDCVSSLDPRPVRLLTDDTVECGLAHRTEGEDAFRVLIDRSTPSGASHES